MFAYAKPEQKQSSKDTVQRKEAAEMPAYLNRTGIPDEMKTRFENLSGFSFDDVRVHYNSDKPAQLQALAYTQGSQVYVAPGQERHLGHELGHVVQQKGGRVRADTKINGMPVNTARNLENEADLGCAIQLKSPVKNNGSSLGNAYQTTNVVQLNKAIGSTVYFGHDTDRSKYMDHHSPKESSKSGHQTVDSLNQAIGFDLNTEENSADMTAGVIRHSVNTVIDNPLKSLSKDEGEWVQWLTDSKRKEALLMRDMTTDAYINSIGLYLNIKDDKRPERSIFDREFPEDHEIPAIKNGKPFIWKENFSENVPKGASEFSPQSANITMAQYSQYDGYLQTERKYEDASAECERLRKDKELTNILDATRSFNAKVIRSRFWRLLSLMAMDFLVAIKKRIEFVRPEANKDSKADYKMKDKTRAITDSEWEHANEYYIGTSEVERVDPV